MIKKAINKFYVANLGKADVHYLNAISMNGCLEKFETVLRLLKKQKFSKSCEGVVALIEIVEFLLEGNVEEAEIKASYYIRMKI